MDAERRFAGELPQRPAKAVRLVALGLLLAHGALLAWSALRHGPTWNEMGHLVGGISHWYFGAFDLCRVNPPLVRMVAAVPAVLADPEIDWRGYDRGAGARSEGGIQRRFVRANGERAFWLLTLARWSCLPFSWLGGYICYRWARELYGAWGGLLALTLWCFSPNVLGNGQLITTDAAAAALGAAAGYLFWRWLIAPNWERAVFAGIVLGLAELTKTTWVVLFLLWPALWAVFRWNERSRTARQDEPRREQRKAQTSWTQEGCQVGLILLLAVGVINFGYGFEGSCKRLGDYQFVSQTLGGPSSDFSPIGIGRNRFRGTWLGKVPVPLPKNYVLGIDLQKSDFENQDMSYLRGQWRVGGWWYYYLYAMAIKVPLGTWVLLLLATGASLLDARYRSGWRNEFVLLSPAIVVLIVVSSQTGFNHHLHYVLPIFPFLFVWIGKAGRAADLAHRKSGVLGVLALSWSVASSLWVYPHNLSYFNELVGGPTGGHAHLGGVYRDSNIDWGGQDILYLRRWMNAHPEAQPLCVALNCSYDVSVLGIEPVPPPAGPETATARPQNPHDSGPLPGWHALSVNRIRSRTNEYEYFLRFTPVAMAGYSIYIYHVTPEEANRVRRALRLPGLAED